MKNRHKRNVVLALGILSGLLLIMNCSLSSEKARWSKVGRYENKRIGFSVEYDAEKLTRELPPIGPFIFRKQSSEEYPSLAISAGNPPQGIALKNTPGLITGSFPRLIPGSRVHGVFNQKIYKLADKTEVNYFEVKWNSGSKELSTAFMATLKNSLLITVSATDKVENPVEDLAAIVKTLKFDIKVDEMALRAEGFGKDGRFIRTNSPAFNLRYPKNFQDRPLQSGQIFNAGIPQGSPSIIIAIIPLNPDEDIKGQLNSQAAGYANILKSVGSDIKIISNEVIDNYKEFPANQFEIVWKFRGQIPITTMVHAIAKENNAILLAGHTVYDSSELLDIFKTINLNP